MSIQRKLAQSRAISLKKSTIQLQNLSYEVQLPYFGGESAFSHYLSSNPALNSIYQLVMANKLRQNYRQAIFFAEKLLSLISEDYKQQAIFLLGMVHYDNLEYSAVFNLFFRHKVLYGDFCVLAAKSLFENKSYDLAIEILDEEVSAEADFVRGRCYESLENKQLAVSNYFECLSKQPTNVCAFNQLVDSFLISQHEKQSLLTISPPDWLRDYYISKISSIDQNSVRVFEGLHEEKKRIVHLLGLSDTEMKIEQQSPIRVKNDEIFSDIYSQLDRKNNIDVLSVKAKRAYYNYDIAAAYDWSIKAIKQDPLHFDIMPVYVSCLLELDQLAELYYCAHSLIENYTQHALSWFVVGVYYFCTKKYEVARKQFQKAIQINQHLLFAWIGLAHSYAIQDESDQAMSIYRSIARQFPGCYQAHVYIGMEYLRTNNLKTAILSLHQAREINPTDPMIYNELGVIAFKSKQYHEAKDYFLTALAFCQNSNHKIRESALQNLGHTYRKARDYKNAIIIFEKCIQLNSTSPQVFFGLAFSYHLSELPHSLTKAIHYYHKSLSLKSDQTFVQEILGKALQDAAELSCSEYIN